MSETQHPQTRITCEGVEMDVDVGMAPLIRTLWALDFETTGSCQGFETSPRPGWTPGQAYVAFNTKDDCDTFGWIVWFVSEVTIRVKPDSDKLELDHVSMGLNPDYVILGWAATDGDDRWAIGFPPTDIQAVHRETLRLLAEGDDWYDLLSARVDEQLAREAAEDEDEYGTWVSSEVDEDGNKVDVVIENVLAEEEDGSVTFSIDPDRSVVHRKTSDQDPRDTSGGDED